MTVDEQLQAMARRAESEQRPITVEEIVARASAGDGARPLDPLRPTPAWRHRRHWFLVAAAVIVAIAAVGLVALDADDDEPVRVVTDPPTTTSTTVPASEVFGGAIVFAADAGAGPALTDDVDYARVEQRPEPMDIYITPAGEPTRRLVSSGAHEQCPAFSPDGERLAYLSVPHGNSPERPLVATLVVVRLDGALELSDPELVVPHPAPLEHAQVWRNIGYPCPQWSPDGSRLAFLAQPVGASAVQQHLAELRVVTLDGQEQVIDGVSQSLRWWFAWSPSGEAIAFLRDDGVWAATLDGRAPSLLWQADGTPTAVSWSSDGELAVAVETEDAGPVVHVVDTDGGSEALGSLFSSWDSAPSWSPEGTRLAFVRTDRQIVLHDRDAGSTVLLPPPQVDGRTVGFDDVAWSPSGEQLLVLAHAVDTSRSSDDDAFLMERGLALLALSTDGTLIDVLTPWSWAFDWTHLDDVASYPDE